MTGHAATRIVVLTVACLVSSVLWLSLLVASNFSPAAVSVGLLGMVILTGSPTPTIQTNPPSGVASAPYTFRSVAARVAARQHHRPVDVELAKD